MKYIKSQSGHRHELNIDQLKKWINALYSGEFKQSCYQLQNQTGYCCLGVGCKVLIPIKKLSFDTDFLNGDMPCKQRFAPEWLKHISEDFEKRTGTSLTYLNDFMNFTFEEIGMLLELVYIHDALG